MHRLLIGLALVVGALVPATSAAGADSDSAEATGGGIGIRLAEAPVATADNPRANVYVVDHVSPGTLVDRRLEVSNGTDEEVTVSVYPSAAEISDGAFVGAAEGASNELTTWIAVSSPTLTLAPGEIRDVDMTIDVPSDATVGEHYAAVWAAVSETPEGGGVTQVTRVGVRIYLSVGEGGAPPSDFEITGLAASRTPDGAPVVEATVTNTGARALDLTAELELSDGPGGLSAGPFSTDPVTTLGIDQSAPVSVTLDPLLPNGPWSATLTVRSGLEERSVETELTFPEPGETVDATPGDGMSPVILVAIGVALIAGILAIVLAVRRARKVQR